MKVWLENYNRNFRRASLTGFMIGTSYVPFFPWAILWGWVPLWRQAAVETSLRRVFWQGWCAQFILTLIGFHWVAYVGHEFGAMPWAVAIFLVLVFASLVHLYIPLTLTFAKFIQLKLSLSKVQFYILTAGLLALGEIYWPSLFQWHMGYTFLWLQNPISQGISQWSDTVGFQGLSFMLLVINAAFAGALDLQDENESTTHKAKPLVRVIAGVSLVFAFLAWSGLQKQKKWQNPTEHLSVLAVQANIGNLEKMASQWGRGFQSEIIQQYLRLSRQGVHATGPIDLITWPESAFPAALDASDINSPYAQTLIRFLQTEKVGLLTGGYSHEMQNRSGVMKDIDFNAMFVFDQQGQATTKPYRKTQLLAFGEFMPMEETFPFLSNINPNGGSFGRGQGPKVLPFPVRDSSGAQSQILLGGQICYESLDPDFSRKLAQLGAQILVNGTNDSWFGPRSEPYQHMIMTLARALEARRPMIRTTNTGITTAILADGTRLESSPINDEWFYRFDIGYEKNPKLTFFSLYGGWLPLMIVFITGSLIGLMFLLSRRRGRT